ncbi:dihydrofolate reductase-like domain-containing protein [Crepidotus variabilis]|uniref:2,5-diamino-6-ribosylamino-4(3H)-pyrimidinone 5'-phosphate reductase n=1 Tax=Crepidotus variabilis TaxID=179855 RepID=A0A9P6ECK3_9AGAR|nr:dihydrofolate reductase-like domain-containing protein [Crepidotus variabilis]
MNFDLNLAPPAFLSKILLSRDGPKSRPSVTLTFAQSIDAKIGISNGTQLMLSCKETFVMTHWMRTMHDAILVGIGTVLNDDPQLNVRHLPQPAEGGKPHHLPRPVILDKKLELPPSCKLLKNFQAGCGRRPWVIYADDSSLSSQESIEFENRRKELESAGAKLIKADFVSPNGYIPIETVLKSLYFNGVQSLMVEGGAKVIESFLSSKDVDRLVITAAPVFVGAAGVGYSLTSTTPVYKVVHKENIGKDTVLVLEVTASNEHSTE